MAAVTMIGTQQDLRTPRVTASVYAILLRLREQFSDARWNLACGLEPSDCVLTLYAEKANAWRVREAVSDLLEQSRVEDGISLILVVQPLEAANFSGVQTQRI